MLFFHFLIVRTSPVTNIASTSKSDIGMAVAVEIRISKSVEDELSGMVLVVSRNPSDKLSETEKVFKYNPNNDNINIIITNRT